MTTQQRVHAPVAVPNIPGHPKATPPEASLRRRGLHFAADVPQILRLPGESA